MSMITTHRVGGLALILGAAVLHSRNVNHTGTLDRRDHGR